MLTVNEIFHSIQGESTRAGDRCVFVRLTACDLRCSWCDTPYAFHEGRKMSLDDVMSAVEAYGCPLLEITGGEPLLQEGVYDLMDRLLAAGHTVLLETGGHRPIDRVPAAVVGTKGGRPWMTIGILAALTAVFIAIVAFCWNLAKAWDSVTPVT